MYDGSRRVLAADLLKNQARKAAARNRKQISLERLKNKVDAQRARARDMHVGARKKHAKGLEPQSTQRQPALCTDESGEPIVEWSDGVAEKSRHCSDQVATPPSSPIASDAGPQLTSARKVGAALTSATKETGRQRHPQVHW